MLLIILVPAILALTTRPRSPVTVGILWCVSWLAVANLWVWGDTISWWGYAIPSVGLLGVAIGGMRRSDERKPQPDLRIVDKWLMVGCLVSLVFTILIATRYGEITRVMQATSYGFLVRNHGEAGRELGGELIWGGNKIRIIHYFLSGALGILLVAWIPTLISRNRWRMVALALLVMLGHGLLSGGRIWLYLMLMVVAAHFLTGSWKSRTAIGILGVAGMVVAAVLTLTALRWSSGSLGIKDYAEKMVSYHTYTPLLLSSELEDADSLTNRTDPWFGRATFAAIENLLTRGIFEEYGYSGPGRALLDTINEPVDFGSFEANAFYGVFWLGWLDFRWPGVLFLGIGLGMVCSRGHPLHRNIGLAILFSSLFAPWVVFPQFALVLFFLGTVRVIQRHTAPSLRRPERFSGSRQWRLRPMGA